MNFRTKFRNIILKHLIQIGFYGSRTTHKDRLKEFFSKIKPYSTNHHLIRIGSESDGGYLVPDDLKGIRTCFSPGVSQIASFELDLANRDIRSYMADYSVDAPPQKNELFDFQKKYLGITNDETFMTLESWVNSKAIDDSNLILQMDIEGAEYGVILHTPLDILTKFRIIIIEFHNLETLYFPNGFELINLAFSKLLQCFEIVHIHPNNCRPPIQGGEFEVPQVMEFTFLRKDRIASKNLTQVFPHPLDVQNVDHLEDVVLHKCWYAPQ